MPEGDAVWRTARRLDRALTGRVLTGFDLRVPTYATSDLSGGRVEATVSRGKHLLTRISLGEERWTLHTHLRMEGSWRVYRPGARWQRPAHTARAVLTTAQGSAVGFSLGIVELLATGDEATAVGHLGPDLLGTDWDAAEAVRRLRADPDRSIGEALMDQTCLAGIGTIYRAETLLLAGVDPHRPVAQVPLERIADLAHRLLMANRERRDLVTTGDTRRGRGTWVYGRERLGCLRCGGPVRKESMGLPPRDRLLWWCPACQT